ncbi:hypothetical protein A3K86_10815 [Photobacterium jeanii]|uniref:Uncharacterized protein n=2 Tax=Photobacterium jeanii TaxID=858640 RepID=A0A178KGY0_9GAMM|nr:hypothetical protein A3K86_10815 [Photobacterium jeanii]
MFLLCDFALHKDLRWSIISNQLQNKANKIMKSSIFFTLFCSALLTGCSSSIPFNAQSTTEQFTLPSLNQSTQVYVGDYMIDEGVNVTDNYLIVKQPIDGAAYDIGKGDYKLLGTEKSGKMYFSHFSTNGGYVIQGPLIDPPYALSPDDKDGLCVSTVFVKNATCYKEAQTEVVKKSIDSPSAFQRTLIYNGSVGKKINISYREFSGGNARQAFTNNVEYDMSKSNIINYKGAEIEVIDFNNSSITYKVRKYFR